MTRKPLKSLRRGFHTKQIKGLDGKKVFEIILRVVRSWTGGGAFCMKNSFIELVSHTWLSVRPFGHSLWAFTNWYLRTFWVHRWWRSSRSSIGAFCLSMLIAMRWRESFWGKSLLKVELNYRSFGWDASKHKWLNFSQFQFKLFSKTFPLERPAGQPSCRINKEKPFSHFIARPNLRWFLSKSAFVLETSLLVWTSLLLATEKNIGTTTTFSRNRGESSIYLFVHYPNYTESWARNFNWWYSTAFFLPPRSLGWKVLLIIITLMAPNKLWQ